MAQATDAHLILDAVQFATEADLTALGQLTANSPETLRPELILRIVLTFLPENVEPNNYTGFVRDVVSENIATLDRHADIARPSKELSAHQAINRIHRLRLVPLRHSSIAFDNCDLLTQFLVSRAHRIDSETGTLYLLRDLLQPFVHHSKFLEVWISSTVFPLLHYELDISPGAGATYTLASFEALKGASGLEELLSRTIPRERGADHDEGWCLRTIVGPWMYGEILRVTLASTGSGGRGAGLVDSKGGADGLYDDLFRWILIVAKNDFTVACNIFERWNGPHDVKFEGEFDGQGFQEKLSRFAISYAQACLASAYVCEESGATILADTRRLLKRVATLSSIPQQPDLEASNRSTPQSSLSSAFVTSLSRIHVLPVELLEESNPLTRPNAEAIDLACYLLASVRKLDSLGHKLSMSHALSLGPFGSESDQRFVLLNVLHSPTSGASLNDGRWISIREDLQWLQNWDLKASSEPGVSPAVFGRLGVDELEIEILKALLTDSRFPLALNIYCQSSARPLPPNTVEEVVLEVGLKTFDSASNGNKTRGGIKKTSQLVNTFQPSFPESAGFRQLSALIQATHSLSFYSLALQRGVPLLPASIRAYQSPLTIVDKVLDQNSKSYTKLDDLLEVGRNLVRAGLVKGGGSLDARESDLLSKVERSIIASTIRAALAEHDFDTAYAYIVNRLSSPGAPSPSNQEAGQVDDVLWQAAFEAGRYRPSTASAALPLRRLEQKTELLSQALVLAPTSSVPEVLEAWRESEKDVNAALTTETEDESTWRERESQQPPGAFLSDDTPTKHPNRSESVRASANDEAPMGLFDVARGAAAALHKSAFPLQGQRNMTLSSPTDSEEGRVRKRDVVSNMVTGGLASGLGWVLGAQPAKEQ